MEDGDRALITTVSGTKTVGGAARTIAAAIVRDNGAREVQNVDVTGDRNRIRQMVSSVLDIPSDNITFDPRFDD